MPGGRTPNKARFIEVATIYRDTMVLFIEKALGHKDILSQILSNEARKYNQRKYDEDSESYNQGEPIPHLIDQADIVFLIEKNLRRFPDLEHADVSWMHDIRELWNRKIKHFKKLGDLNPEDVAEYEALCARILRHCGFGETADYIVAPWSSAATEVPATMVNDFREQRERREWDKQRLANKPPDSLMMWEQQRLAEIEWEEEWERREQEREEIGKIGRDIDTLRRWFDADAGRSHCHASEFADLEHAEAARLGREREEIAEIGQDIDTLRCWFDADAGRSHRHASEFATLEHAEAVRLDREREEIAEIGQDIDTLRCWFDADHGRKQRHPSDFAWLEQRDQEQYECKERHETLRREREEIARIGQDINALGNFFDADDERKQRYPSHFTWLESAEAKVWQQAKDRLHHEREELTQIGYNIRALRDWFEANPSRQVRHRAGFARFMQHRLVSGGPHNLVVCKDGSVAGWVANHLGQCNAPDGKFIAVSAGWSHSLGLREDGSIACWGNNAYGQCNAPDGKFIAVSAGGFHSLGLCEDGSVVCWSYNYYGQCNAPDGKFVAVSAGRFHSLGLREDGLLACWGNDGNIVFEDGSIAYWGWQGDGRSNPPEGDFLP